jgi:antitoxin (DNA-binding transcriptional repressor) of toxin-antitoxin stability system
MTGMHGDKAVLTLSAREADRKLAAAIDRVNAGEARAVLLTRHGFGVGVILALRDAPGEVQQLLQHTTAASWPVRRAGGAKR